MIDFQKIGYKPDGEYEGVFHHPDAPIYIWIKEENPGEKQLAISWDMEYTIYRDVSEQRIIDLFNSYKK